MDDAPVDAGAGGTGVVTRGQRLGRSFLVAAWLGLLGTASTASAQGAWDGLPTPVVASIERAVEKALVGPEVRLSQQRLAFALDATAGPSPRWEASVGARASEYGVRLHGRGALSVDLVDPSRPRTRAAARTATRQAELETGLAAREAAMDALTTWLGAWAARERVALAHAAASAPASEPIELRRRQGWIDRLPALELEARIWEDRLRASGVRSPIAWPTFDAWRAWASAPWETGLCATDSFEVRVARAELDRLREERLAASQAATTPSLRLGLDLSLATSLDGAAPVDAGGRLWLRLGAPSAWPARGSLEVASEGRDAQLELRVGSDESEASAGSPDLTVEAAAARLAQAVREAGERRALERASWAAEIAAVAAAPPSPPADGATLAEVQALLDVVASTVAAVQLRAESRADCTEVPSSPANAEGVVAP